MRCYKHDRVHKLKMNEIIMRNSINFPQQIDEPDMGAAKHKIHQ